MGYHIVVGVTLGNAQTVGVVRRGVEQARSDLASCTEKQGLEAGILHAISEVGAAALSAATEMEPTNNACDLCARAPRIERFCAQVGRALAAGELDAAVDAAIRFEDGAVRAPAAHSFGVAEGLASILCSGTARLRSASLDGASEETQLPAD